MLSNVVDSFRFSVLSSPSATSQDSAVLSTRHAIHAIDRKHHAGTTTRSTRGNTCSIRTTPTAQDIHRIARTSHEDRTISDTRASTNPKINRHVVRPLLHLLVRVTTQFAGSTISSQKNREKSSREIIIVDVRRVTRARTISEGGECRDLSLEHVVATRHAVGTGDPRRTPSGCTIGRFDLDTHRADDPDEDR